MNQLNGDLRYRFAASYERIMRRMCVASSSALAAKASSSAACAVEIAWCIVVTRLS